jgi:hypothetical protein
MVAAMVALGLGCLGVTCACIDLHRLPEAANYATVPAE